MKRKILSVLCILSMTMQPGICMAADDTDFEQSTINISEETENIEINDDFEAQYDEDLFEEQETDEEETLFKTDSIDADKTALNSLRKGVYHMKIKIFVLCCIMLFSSCAVSFAADAASRNLLLSPNENLSGAGKFSEEAEITWNTTGKYASDVNFVENADSLFDGNTQTQITSVEDVQNNAYASITMKWQEQVQISEVRAYFVGTETSNIEGFEVYAANGNDNFTKIANVINTYTSSSRPRQLKFTAADNIYARELKIIISKKAGCASMQLSEIAVFGGECEFERENVNKNYHYEREEPFLSDYDIYYADPYCEELSKENYYLTKTSYDDYISVIYEFDDYYQVDYVQIFGDGDGVEMMQSADGSQYFTNGYTSFKNREADIYAMSGKNARYIKIVLHKKDCYLLELDHINIYARKVYDSSKQQDTKLTAVPLRCELKSNNLLYLDWTGYNGTANGAARYNVYIDKEELTASNIKNKEAKTVFYGGNEEYTSLVTEKFVSCFGLEPETEYNVAVVPVAEDGTFGTELNVVKIKSYDQLGSGSISSLFCWNDYPYYEAEGIKEGVNDRPATGDYSVHDNIRRKLKLTSEMEGISRTRWYNESDEMFRKYGSNGIAFLPSGRNTALNNKFSNYTFECMNEPNFSDATFEEVTQAIRNANTALEAAGENNLLAAPTIGATESDIEYFRNLYAADPELNDHYDVLDLHPYIQSFLWDPMEGIEGDRSVPEHIDKFFDNIDYIRDEFNIDKPVIFSEFGWCTATGHIGNWWAELLSHEQQARFIPRYYIMTMEHDYVKNVYLYAFEDMAYLTTDPEYQFGIVDFYGKPKNAYYTYYTMVKILKDAQFEERIPNDAASGSGIVYPNYAYRFRDEKRNNNIIACWNANNDNVKLQITSPEEITVVDSYGNTETVESGNSITICGDVKYILSHGEISIQLI